MDTPVVDNQGNSAVQDKGKSASEHDHVIDDGDDDDNGWGELLIEGDSDWTMCVTDFFFITGLFMCFTYSCGCRMCMRLYI